MWSTLLISVFCGRTRTHAHRHARVGMRATPRNRPNPLRANTARPVQRRRRRRSGGGTRAPTRPHALMHARAATHVGCDKARPPPRRESLVHMRRLKCVPAHRDHDVRVARAALVSSRDPARLQPGYREPRHHQRARTAQHPGAMSRSRACGHVPRSSRDPIRGLLLNPHLPPTA